MKRLVLGFFVLCMTVAGAGGWWLWQDWQAFATRPLQLPEDHVHFDVQRGTGALSVVNQLIARGWWQPTRTWHWRLARTPQLTRLQAGEYRLKSGMTLVECLQLLTSGAVVEREVTLVEGRSWREIRTLLAGAERLQQTLPALSDKDALAALDSELSRAAPHPEGLFFPDTYRYTAQMSDLDLLKQAHRRLQAALAAHWQNRKKDLPIRSPYEALVLASLVEKETGVAEERARIAGVFVQRLNTGMRLQTDPAVIYGLGERFDGNLRKADLQADTPWNTYTRAGLPPTPIALVGEAALRAAAQPEITGEVYFVATGDGRHVFSRTLAEHNRAVRQFQLRRSP